ncbi:MAG TPA: hypothetical protein DEF41_11070 [Desulfovibrio sp.]|nr:hypothetical protein [Desulfovibrio sp.]
MLIYIGMPRCATLCLHTLTALSGKGFHRETGHFSTCMRTSFPQAKDVLSSNIKDRAPSVH